MITVFVCIAEKNDFSSSLIDTLNDKCTVHSGTTNKMFNP